MVHASPRAVNHAQTALFSLAMGLGIPLLFQHLEATFQLGSTRLGLLAALFGGLQVLVRVPVGAVVDRWGEDRVLEASWALLVAAGAAFLVADTVPLVTGAVALFGLSVGIFWVASNTLAARLAPPGGIASAMTAYMVATGLGFMLGPLLGGVADVVGFQRALALLTPMGVVGWFAARRLPVPAVDIPPGAPEHRRVSALGTGVSTAFLFGVLLGTADSFVPAYLGGAGISSLGVGLFVSGREGTNLALRLLTVRLVADRSAGAFLAIGAVAAAAGMWLFPRAGLGALLALSAALMGVGIGLWVPASLTLAARGSQAGTAGRAMGAWGTALGLGMLVGPGLLGPIGEAAGAHWLFDGTAIACAVAGAVALGHQIRVIRD